MAAPYRAAGQPGSATVEEANLIEAGIDLGQLAAFHVFAETSEALDAAAYAFADAAGYAARKLGLDLDELLHMLGHRNRIAQIISDHADLESLVTGGEQ